MRDEPESASPQLRALSGSPGLALKSRKSVEIKPKTALKTLLAQGIKKSLKGKQAVTVSKWVDYSSKYGLGYILSNG